MILIVDTKKKWLLETLNDNVFVRLGADGTCVPKKSEAGTFWWPAKVTFLIRYL